VPALDRFLPRWDVRERHATYLAVPAEDALRLALTMPVAVDPLVRLLLVLRGMDASGSLEQFFQRHGFLLLHKTATAYTVGLPVMLARRPLAGLPDAGDWNGWAPPGGLKIATTFLAQPAGGDHSRFCTETRVFATDASARRRFAVYWFFVGPFSSLIRRRWLHALRRRSLHELSGGAP